MIKFPVLWLLIVHGPPATMDDLIPIMTDTRGQPGKHLAVAGIYDSEGLCLQNKNRGDSQCVRYVPKAN
jgi:hypothetical protein